MAIRVIAIMRLMTQLWGAMAMRLANADVLPFDFDSYADNMRQFLVDLDEVTHVKQHVTGAPAATIGAISERGTRVEPSSAARDGASALRSADAARAEAR